MSHLSELAQLALDTRESCSDDIDKAAKLIADAFNNGHKLLVCGNGGSAADAQHFSAEYVGRYQRERRPLPAISLATDTSALTAIGNDFGYETVFSRQVEALGNYCDVLVIISTGGMSPNLIAAAITARNLGITCIALTGSVAHDELKTADLWIAVPSTHTAHVQEVEMALLHMICEGVEKLLEEA